MTDTIEARAHALHMADQDANPNWQPWVHMRSGERQRYIDLAKDEASSNTTVITQQHEIRSSRQMNSADIINNISKLAGIIGPDIVNADLRCYGEDGRVFKIVAIVKETT